MDEELLKRNTDCVYFLASPFTCKKGADCDYKHSEMARLNPRDCWYWLSGRCLNLTCGFRHPPLEVHTRVSTESESLFNHSSFPPSKNKLPCYFYFHGYCNKGDKCFFLHGAEDTSAWKPNTDSETNHVPPLDTKTSTETSGTQRSAETFDPKVQVGTVDARTRIENLDLKFLLELYLLQLQQRSIFYVAMPKAGAGAQMQEKQQLQKSVKYKIVEVKPACGLASKYEEKVPTKSESSNPLENTATSEPSLCSDQSFKDQIKDGVGQDEWCESSPGFDVLVHERLQDIGYDYENGPEYMHGYDDGYDGNDEHKHLFVDHQGYDKQTDYGRRNSHEYSYYSDGDEHRFDLVGFSRGHRDRELNHMSSKKRKFFTMDLPNRAGTSLDLRDHLTKRRLGDGQLERPVFRRRNTSFHAVGKQERVQRNGSGRFCGRLGSRVERNGVEVLIESSQLAAQNDKGRAANSLFSGSRRRYRESKRAYFS